jgi:hypothetical protein
MGELEITADGKLRYREGAGFVFVVGLYTFYSVLCEKELINYKLDFK